MSEQETQGALGARAQHVHARFGIRTEDGCAPSKALDCKKGDQDGAAPVSCHEHER